MRTCLIDTGPFVSYLDRKDPAHADVADFLDTLKGQLIVELTRPHDTLGAAELMHKYRDTPMDFADATLVLLADRAGTTDILTLDRRGFSTYRTGKGRAFRLALD
jgi:predicted nucleic acid-binding protein